MNLENQTSQMQDEMSGADTDVNPQEEQQEEQQEKQFDFLLQTNNIASKLSKEKLTMIGKVCLEGYNVDKQSRKEWEHNVDEWLKLAMQTKEEKSFPWPKASNIKYPLISTAAMQFSARAYPTLIPSNGAVVHAIPVGVDVDGSKGEKAERVSRYMSYQVLYDMDGWEEDMDRLLMMVPIVGTVFKKTYYDKSLDKVQSYLISPKNLVVNYWATDLESCERVSEIIEMSKRVYEEKLREEVFIDQELGDPIAIQDNGPTLANDATTPYYFIQQSTFIDLDDDGYAEPYIVTFHRESGKVVSIVARFFKDDIHMDNNKIIKIIPRQLYTKYGFIPNPDGSFYNIGFGVLLGPLNESVNTLINQLVDSGTLNNMQSGYIGKGLRIKMGDNRFQPGEWKPVNATADDLRKQIVPLPSKEPSKVLFELMGSLISSGKELASVAEIFVGKMPGQNTPATTTMATIEQGMKVFTAVYKRIYRSLAEEFDKIFELNRIFLDPNKYISVLDITIDPKDFDESAVDIEPGADPTAISQTEKLVKAQGLQELLAQFGPMMNPVEVLTRILQAQEQPNMEKLLSQEVAQTGQPPQPAPDPKVMEIQMKSQAEQQKLAMQSQVNEHKAALEQQSQQAQLAMAAQEQQFNLNAKQQEMAAKMAAQRHGENAKALAAQHQLVQNQQAHVQKMQHNEETHKSKLQQQRQISKNGNNTSSQKNSSKK